MSLAVIYSRAIIGVQAPSVTVEVHISNGLPGLTLVGLPETTVKEARDRSFTRWRARPDFSPRR